MSGQNSLPDSLVEKIADEYIAHISIPAEKPQQMFFLCPVGLAASGKTTIMKELCERLNLVRIRTDDIRIMLRSKGYDFERTTEIGFIVAQYFADHGYSIGVDADCADPKNRDRIEAVSKKSGAQVVYVHMNTPDDYVRHHVLQNGHTEIFQNKEEVLATRNRRRYLHEDLSDIPFVYTFDLSKGDIGPQVDAAAEKIMGVVS